MNNTREKIAKANINRYNDSRASELFHVYGKYSTAKARAFDYCRNLMNKLDGWGLKILSYNTFMFTAGFLFVDKETGVTKFMYITPSYDTATDY